MSVRNTWFLCACLLGVLACGDDSSMAFDGGNDDTGVDAAPECTTDRTCDDGLFCNGVESCETGTCVPGETILCDDGIECTIDLCDDELDACVAAAPDVDGDGSRDAACLDGDGAPLGADCDDADALRFPGNPEVCDLEGHDEDCDLDTIGARDLDGDGYIDDVCCNPDGEGGMNCGQDCDDLRPNANPATTEVCDSIDNDCDASIDEGVRTAGFVDADRDGFGDATLPLEACPGRPGFVPAGAPADCDDDDPSRNPGQVEICDGQDNDCDDTTTDADGRPVDWFADLDGDGFGSRASGVVMSCEPVAGHTLRDNDCDDTAAAINPAATEMCNGLDDDCNGAADFEVAPGDFEDDDGDGLLDLGCGPPGGVDCDDRDPSAGPGTEETCDGRDNDCDEIVDEDAEDRSWFYDGDGDGFGTDSDPENAPVRSCTPPAGYVANADDCNDGSPNRFPGAVERCNTADDDCDGDVDEDGVCGCPPGLSDCDGDGSCETDTRVDQDNCGGCGTVCAGGPDALAVSCSASTCQIDACAANRADCDGTVSNGCETRTDSIDDCGGCGRTCLMPFGMGVTDMNCEAGRCVVATCEEGVDDCNGQLSDGCERDTSSDILNCGACGNACTMTSSFPMCVSGTCFSECVPGETEDCDGDPSNGCETRLDTPSDCGGCGVVCPVGDAGTFSECRVEGGGARCENQCRDGFADCDGLPSNGCEAPMDPTSCGCPPTTVRDCTTFFPAGSTSVCVGRVAGAARCEVRTCGVGALCNNQCVDTMNDESNCGSCGFFCPAGEVCAGGACACTAPRAICDGFCVDRTTDPDHCGACGRNCNFDERCEGGACVTSCGAPFTLCDTFCTDTNTDPTNCGTCGTSCFTGEVCEAGSCVPECFPPNVRCGGACTDNQTDPNNCGVCGNACPAPGTMGIGTSACLGGSCEVSCQTGRAGCDADPSDCEQNVSNDPLNCGGCGISCGPGGTCSGGVCDRIAAVVTSPTNTCAVRSNGSLLCWGDNGSGQLAAAAPTESATPLLMPLTGVRDVAVGIEAICAVAFDGGSGLDRIFCWGNDGRGQLGHGGISVNTNTPTLVTGQSGVALQVVMGDEHTCGLWDDAGANEIHCWGSGAFGANGDSGAADRQAPIQVFVSREPRQLAAGPDFNCSEPRVVFDGLRLECWGLNATFQQGRTGADSGLPTDSVVMPFEGMSFLTMGQTHTCAIFDGDTGAEIWCWGADEFGQSGIGSGTTGTQNPARTGTPGGRSVRELSMDPDGTCALFDDGSVWCRGANTSQDMIPGGLDPAMSWTQIVDLGFQIKQLSDSYGGHRCAIAHSGDVYCWGRNSDGQCGSGATSTVQGVARVVGLTD